MSLSYRQRAMREVALGCELDLVRARPRLWLLVMVLYPIVSVYPQELIYRAFFFHRYAPLDAPFGCLSEQVGDAPGRAVVVGSMGACDGAP